MSHPIEQHALPGIGPGRRTRLSQAGFLTLEDLVAAGVDKVSAVPHVPDVVAARAIEAAQAILDAAAVASPQSPPDVPVQPQRPLIEEPDEAPEPAASAPAEGSDEPAATRGWKPIESLRDVVHRAADHADKAPDGKARERVREALDRLDHSLQELSEGAADLSKKQRRKLKRAFEDTEEALERLVGRKAKAKRLHKAKDAVDAARDAVKKVLG